jgi:thiamine biosynthesis lipoprotein
MKASAVVMAVTGLGLPGAAQIRFEYTQIHMGGRVNLTLYAPDQSTAETAAAAAFRRFAEIEQVASDYRNTSEISQLVRQPVGVPIRISADLATMLAFSQRLARQSGGAFDITASPVVRLWRKARRTGVMPGASARNEARARVGSRFLRLDSQARTVTLLRPDLQLDFGGIAKGYAADEALRALKQAGVSRALIQAGGDIVAGDAPPGRSGWRVGVPGLAGTVFRLRNQALSTSGDRYQRVEIGGRVYSHIVDPRTGLGLTNRRQATVLARRGIESDALATAACVVGPEFESVADRYRADLWFAESR